jgi:hypothetical protein
MKTNGEHGIALVLSLFLIAAMSVIAASLMLLSQTETYSSMNYRLMSQARYGAESGVHMATNYILYSYPATAPGTASDPITNYDITKSPVLCVAGCPALNKPVILSANANQPSNYPVAPVQAAFAAAAAGALPAGNTSVAFAPYAKLISMQRLNVYGGGLQTIQTWQIVSTGTITQGKTAQAEVSAIIETPKFPATMYAAFATAATCGALDFHGQNTQTDSYDSSKLVAGLPNIAQSGGHVGTNGNLSEGGGADIFGMLSSPRVGIGSCSSGNVDALSTSGGATVNGHSPPTVDDIIHLPAAVTLPAVTVPTGVPTGNVSGNGQTWTNASCAPTAPPCSFGDVTVNANSTLTLGAVGAVTTINVNSLKLAGNADIQILGTVILNVVGAGDASPIEILGNGFANSSYDPSTFQIQYAGTGTVKLTGGSHSVAMIYAPNAAVQTSGNADFYGSVVGATINDTGGMKIHYDRHLSSEFFVVGNAMMSSFSWKKY